MGQRRSTKPRVNSATNRYLDQACERLGVSDYALAEVLGISTQAIYKMRGGGMMGAATAAKIAHILELDALKVIAETELERGADESFWKPIARKVAAILLVAGAGAAAAPQGAQAEPSPAAVRPGACVLCKVRRRLNQAGFAVLAIIAPLAAL